MKNLKRIGALALACALTLNATAFAALDDTGYADVDADAWYADAVGYVTDNSLMSGTSSTEFSPEDAMTRSMLATVLYRAADTPAVTGTDAVSYTHLDVYKRQPEEIEAGVTGQQHIEQMLDKSLKNLGMDYVDLYIYHMLSLIHIWRKSASSASAAGAAWR